MIYAMEELSGNAPFPVSFQEAMRLNESGNFGIFRPVNEFDGPRKIIHLKRIKAWHVDMDGNKGEQLLKIKDSPIYPSRVVESKNGYHLYFNAKDAVLEHHAEIMKGLVHHFGGDERAKMVTVLLREPGFYHKKDPSNPFKVREIFNLNVQYTERDMLYFFPVPRKGIDDVITKSVAYDIGACRDTLTNFLDRLDHRYALGVLSGSPYVNGETYEFKKVANNHFNIIVNGKSTSCFIDENGRIGAIPGGPVLWSWLRYFNHDNRTIYKILKEHFGESLR